MKSNWIKVLFCVLVLCLIGTMAVSCTQSEPGIDAPEDTEVHVCDFVNKTVAPDFLCKNATCTKPAEYYYSCSCGKKSTRVFSDGAAAGHSYSEVWTYDDDNHWHDPSCDCEVEVADKSAHSFQNNTCTVCGAIYNPPGTTFALNEDENSYALVTLGATSGDVVIPTTYRGLPVTVIRSSAFSNVTDVKTLKIPAGAVEFEAGFQYYLSNLESITVDPANPTFVVQNGCLIEPAAEKLVLATKTGTIPTDGSVTAIADNAFSGNVGVKKLVIPDAVVHIGANAFYGCSELTEVNVGNGVKEIGFGAFQECGNLMSVTIGRSVETIGDMAFYGCPNLLEVCNLSSLSLGGEAMQMTYLTFFAVNVYGEGGQSCIVTVDDDFLFFDDGSSASLLRYTGTKTNVTLPANCNGRNYAIHKFAFEGNEELFGVVIPDSVTAIGESAFAGCTNLNLLDMPSGYNCSLKTIGVNAFAGCRSLPSNVYIPASVTLIGECAFYNSGITHVTFGNEMGWYRTPNPNYVGKKSQSTSTNFTTPVNNAAMLRSTYYNCYFFR